MGCCVSTANISSKPPKALKLTKSTPRIRSISKSPPSAHPILEEETVKEVLSETRIVLKGPSGRAHGGNHQCENSLVKIAPLLSANASRDRRNGVVCRMPHMSFGGGGGDVCEGVGSEICSTLGECESHVCAEKREEKGGESAEQLRKMSPARRRDTPFTGKVKREKIVGSSPGRRSEPSPSRASSCNGTGFGYGRRRNTGDSSGRLSKSPVGQGRRSSPRKTGESPCRVGSGFVDRVRKVDEEGKDGGDRRRPPTSDESLENPLVSLECFIFL